MQNKNRTNVRFMAVLSASHLPPEMGNQMKKECPEMKKKDYILTIQALLDRCERESILIFILRFLERQVQ